MMTEEALQKSLQTQWLGRSLSIAQSLPSTHQWLCAHADERMHGSAIFALRQTAGQGRFGRTWEQREGDLALSLLLKPQAPFFYPLLSQVLALGSVKALKPFGLRADIKWPNDMLVQGQKIGGVLCWAGSRPTGDALVCSVGLNLALSQAELCGMGLSGASSIAAVLGPHAPSLTQLAASLLNTLEPLLDAVLETGDLSPVLGDLQAHCINIGRTVSAQVGKLRHSGLAKAIAPDGALLLETPQGIIRLLAGEATLGSAARG